jgi:hypothetical protein
MNPDLEVFLNHLDECLQLSKPIFKLGERAVIYFNLLGRFTIPIELKEELHEELSKRDHETVNVSYYQGKVYTIIISCAWQLDEDNKIIAPTKPAQIIEQILDADQSKDEGDNNE